VFGILGAQGGAQRRCDLRGGDAAHLLHVVLAVEQVSVDPGAAFLEQAAVLAGRGALAHGARHLFGGAQRRQVVDAAHRVGTVELHVVGVVLHALHHAVAVGVPAAGHPGELQRLADGRPQAAQPRVISRKLPVEIGLDDLPHGSVRRGDAVLLLALWQLHPYGHYPAQASETRKAVSRMERARVGKRWWVAVS